MTISCHCIVKNEENWLWYSLKSVLDFVDEINIIDTGSTDKTPDIISSFSSSKIKTTFLTNISASEFTLLRQRQLEQTSSDWVLLLDGDEIWTAQSLSESIEAIKNNSDLDYLINSYYMCIGDIYHIQPSSAGKYSFLSKTGHHTVRLFRRKIPHLHFSNPYGSEGLFIKDQLLYKASQNNIYISNPYFHTSHLVRSSSSKNQVLMRSKKYKYELGNKLPKNTNFPVSFYLSHPSFVPSPWGCRSLYYILNSSWQTPLKLIKRNLIKYA